MEVVLPGRRAGAHRPGVERGSLRPAPAQRLPCIHAGTACSPPLALLASTSLLPWCIVTWPEPAPRTYALLPGPRVISDPTPTPGVWTLSAYCWAHCCHHDEDPPPGAS